MAVVLFSPPQWWNPNNPVWSHVGQMSMLNSALRGEKKHLSHQSRSFPRFSNTEVRAEEQGRDDAFIFRLLLKWTVSFTTEEHVLYIIHSNLNTKAVGERPHEGDPSGRLVTVRSASSGSKPTLRKKKTAFVTLKPATNFTHVKWTTVSQNWCQILVIKAGLYDNGKTWLTNAKDFVSFVPCRQTHSIVTHLSWRLLALSHASSGALDGPLESETSQQHPIYFSIPCSLLFIGI